MALAVERLAEPPVLRRLSESLEVPVRVVAEVEVELGDRLLDDAPHGLAEIGHEAHQDERVVVVAAVRGEERVLGLLVELVVDREVPEVEERIAHAGVLPVDDPRAAAVGDEVRVQEVVVAGPGSDAGAPPLDGFGDLLRLAVAGWYGDAALECDRPVHLHDAEAVEAGGDGRPGVEPPERAADLLDVDVADLALDVAGDEVALRLDELDDLGRETELGRDPGGGVLRAAVDPEELGVPAADPQDEGPVADGDLEVPVRDPAAERLDACVTAAPETRDDRFGLHAPMLCRSGLRRWAPDASPRRRRPRGSARGGAARGRGPRSRWG